MANQALNNVPALYGRLFPEAYMAALFYRYGFAAKKSTATIDNLIDIAKCNAVFAKKLAMFLLLFLDSPAANHSVKTVRVDNLQVQESIQFAPPVQIEHVAYTELTALAKPQIVKILTKLLLSAPTLAVTIFFSPTAWEILKSHFTPQEFYYFDQHYLRLFSFAENFNQFASGKKITVKELIVVIIRLQTDKEFRSWFENFQAVNKEEQRQLFDTAFASAGSFFKLKSVINCYIDNSLFQSTANDACLKNFLTKLIAYSSDKTLVSKGISPQPKSQMTYPAAPDSAAAMRCAK